MSTTPGPAAARAMLARIRRLASSALEGRQLEDPADPAFTRRVVALEAALQRPPQIPPQLASSEFFEAILERATRDAARAVGSSLLRRTFAPVAAPRDVTWVEPTDHSGLGSMLRTAPPSAGPRPPVLGWRARGRVQAPRQVRRTLLRAAAAALFVAGAFGVFRGTSSTPDLVFQPSSEPLSQDYSSVFLRELVVR